LRFQKVQFGYAQVLERDRFGCVVLDDTDAVASATQRHVRQEEITLEIIELAAGETASVSIRN
jgi:hypothetical protein